MREWILVVSFLEVVVGMVWVEVVVLVVKGD